jgi:hypothetical protein
MLRMAIDATGDRQWEENGPYVITCTDYINSLKNVYSWAYKRVNGNWELVTTLKGRAEFLRMKALMLERAEDRPSGSFHIDYAPENGPKQSLYVSFAQMPMYTAAEERYIIFTCISKDSLVSAVPSWVNESQWASMIITLGLNILLLAWIKQAQRKENEGLTA